MAAATGAALDHARAAWDAQQRLAEGFTRHAWRLVEDRRRLTLDRIARGYRGRHFIPHEMTMDWARLLRQYFIEVAAQFHDLAAATLPGGHDYAAKALPDPIAGLIHPLERHSRVLARHEDAGLEVDLEAIIGLHGVSGPEQQKKLERMFDGWKSARVPNIAVTESTKIGNLATWATVKPKMKYLRFQAIIDGRTTYTCRLRHNKVLPVDGKLLQFNVPPLHHACRSMLVPVSLDEHPNQDDLDFPNDDLSRPADGFGQLLL